LSSENRAFPNADTIEDVEGSMGTVAIGEMMSDSAESKN